MSQKPSQHEPDNALRIAPPTRADERKRPEGAPDLHIEEIEEKHVPKDRNIFDK